MGSNEITSIFNAASIGPLAKVLVDYSAYAAFLILLFAAFYLQFSRNKWPSWVCLGFAIAFCIWGAYLSAFPPERFYVHELLVRLDLSSKEAGHISRFGLYSGEDRVWVSSSVPLAKTEAGRTRYEWRALALDQKDFSSEPTLVLRAGWLDTSASETFERFDNLPVAYAGGASSICSIRQNHDAEQSGEEGAFFKLSCKRRDKAKEGERQAGAWTLPLVGSAHAQSSAQTDYKNMSREDLLRVLESMQNATGSSSEAISPEKQKQWPPLPPDAKKPVVLFYTTDSDRKNAVEYLKPLSIRLIERESKFTTETNSVWVGTDVDVETAKAVAKSLIEAGVKIRYFGYFGDPSIKTNLIEIGSSLKSAGRQPLTLREIDDAAIQMRH